MRKLQFSLLALLGLVSFAAVATAALARPNEWWAFGLLTVAVASVIVALLVAVFRRSRAFAGGFAIVGGAYLLLVFGPGFGERLGPMLLTTQALAYAESKWQPDPNAGSVSASAAADLLLWTMQNGVSAPGGKRWLRNGDPGSSFQQIGQALWTLFLACIGGFGARFWHRRSRRWSGESTANA